MKVKAGIFLLLMVVLAGSLAGAAGQEVILESIGDYYQGRYSQAVEGFDEVISSEELSTGMRVDALYYQTLSYLGLYKPDPARENIEQLKSMGYEFGRLYWKLGTIYLNKHGHFDNSFYNEAKKYLEKASMLGVDTSDFHSDLAMAYQGLGRVRAAIAEYEMALEEREDAGDYRNLASLYQESGQSEKAIEYYEQARELAPDKSAIYLNLGRLYQEAEQPDRAIEVLQDGVERNPRFAALRYQLARAYYSTEEIDRALEEFKEVVDTNKNTYEAYYYMGEIYGARDNLSQAIYNYEQAIKYNPDYAKAYIALGKIYLEEENTYKAISQFTSAIEKNETYPPGHFNLALAYLQSGMKEAAISELRRTVHLAQDHEQAKKLLEELTAEE